MVNRVYFGNDAGAFKLRVSKAGYDARSEADIRNFTLHENMRPLIPLTPGYVTVPANGNVTVNVGRTFSRPPMMILRCDQNYLPSEFTFYAAFTPSTGNLRVSNRTGGQIVARYLILDPNQ